ncbi:formylglycine-generating enzyme family protein [Vandammella animalimorsus]|uniref:Sulphatase-modifying factor protein n=1 Tax=Vandammella animalimorsus TaxID=2029117 RepID=A0A2A2AAR0_9BURK|nr:formylglycine-generating enzyme family protein [Vandammella animalimorsus]PAT34857.1 Sulphatase-modifying factor protein [Vandammella animalimorsus]
MRRRWHAGPAAGAWKASALALGCWGLAQPVLAQPGAALPIEMQAIPAGHFVMGSCLPVVGLRRNVAQANGCRTSDVHAHEDEGPRRQVSVPAFQLGRTPVTLGQFRQYVSAAGRDDLLTPDFLSSNAYGDNAPVVWVSWQDAQDFIAWLNRTQGGGWRLPSEAEWEYACRAGGQHSHCGGSDLSTLGWYDANSGGQQQAVAQKLPNAFGLYDMSGNVWEWVQDCWVDSYQGAPTDGSAWLAGNCPKDRRSLRGGSWGGSASAARAANRFENSAVMRSHYYGFRLARSLEP